MTEETTTEITQRSIDDNERYELEHKYDALMEYQDTEIQRLRKDDENAKHDIKLLYRGNADLLRENERLREALERMVYIIEGYNLNGFHNNILFKARKALQTEE